MVGLVGTETSILLPLLHGRCVGGHHTPRAGTRAAAAPRSAPPQECVLIHGPRADAEVWANCGGGRLNYCVTGRGGRGESAVDWQLGHRCLGAEPSHCEIPQAGTQ